MRFMLTEVIVLYYLSDICIADNLLSFFTDSRIALCFNVLNCLFHESQSTEVNAIDNTNKVKVTHTYVYV